MGKLTIDECKRIISKGRRQLTEAQARIAELEAERDHWQGVALKRTAKNAELRELVWDMARELRGLNDGGISTDCMEHERRMRELGIEVDDEG